MHFDECYGRNHECKAAKKMKKIPDGKLYYDRWELWENERIAGNRIVWRAAMWSLF